MGQLLAASGIGLLSILFSGGDPETASGLTLTVQLSGLPEGLVGPGSEGAEVTVRCEGHAEQSHAIDAQQRLSLRDVSPGRCELSFIANNHSFRARVDVRAGHNLEMVAVTDLGELPPPETASAAPPSSDAVGMSLSGMDSARTIAVESRSFESVVRISEGSMGSDGFQAGTLTAGAVDDLASPKSFGRFLTSIASTAGAFDFGVRWAAVRVTDNAGRPVPGARVRVAHLELTTRADGRVVFVGDFDGLKGLAGLNAQVQYDGGVSRQIVLKLGHSASVSLPVKLPAQQQERADLLLILDTTGSMGDELAYLQVELRAIFESMQRKHPNTDLRWGLIVYRDQGDDYLVRAREFTRDFGEFEASLSEQSANGGGDAPEAVHSAFEMANQLDWRPASQASRVVVHLADAAPHEEQLANALAQVDALRRQGTAVYPVAASGLDAPGEFFMRASALMTGGQYVFLTDDSGYGGAHREASAACFRVNTLASVLQKILNAELRGRRPKLPKGERGEACVPVGVPRSAPGPGRRSMSRSLFDDDAAAQFLHQPYVRRKVH